MYCCLFFAIVRVICQNTIEKSAVQYNSFYRNVSILKLYNIRDNRYNYYTYIY